MKIIFVRHSETDWNKEGRIQGSFNPPINETGRRQAHQLSEEIKNLGIEVIISSPQRRAMDTAKIMADGLGVPEIVLDERLRECSHGSFDGRTKTELKMELGFDHLERWPDSGDYDFTPWGGESRQAVFSRAFEALEDVRSRFANQTVLIVGHGRTINTLLADFGKAPPSLKRGEFLVMDI